MQQVLPVFPRIGHSICFQRWTFGDLRFLGVSVYHCLSGYERRSRSVGEV